MSTPVSRSQPMTESACSCDWATGECQGPLGCKAFTERAFLKARIQELDAALQFIADGYDNHDVNHVDYRVKVYQVALDALSDHRSAKP